MGDNENLRSRRRTSNKPRQRGEQILMEGPVSGSFKIIRVGGRGDSSAEIKSK